MVLRFINSLLSVEREPSSRFDKAMIQATIERVVDGTDPRLRAVRHYRRKLRLPVERMIEYVMAQIAVIADEVALRSPMLAEHLESIKAIRAKRLADAPDVAEASSGPTW